MKKIGILVALVARLWTQDISTDSQSTNLSAGFFGFELGLNLDSKFHIKDSNRATICTYKGHMKTDNDGTFVGLSSNFIGGFGANVGVGFEVTHFVFADS